MAQRPPPPPPEQRNPHDEGQPRADSQKLRKSVPENLKEQDRQGNIHQNTRNQGYQQDR